MSTQDSPQNDAAEIATAEPAVVTGLSMEHFEVDDREPAADDTIYPSGSKQWLTMISLCTAQFVVGLDLTIVAVSVPSLTDQFKTVSAIGWYSAAYGMTMSAFIFFFGKLYTIFSVKTVFITGMVIFEAGSLMCTLSTSSNMFILGRAIAGLGSGAVGAGINKILKHMFPLSKLSLAVSLVAGCQSFGLISAPIVGGALISAWSWRACFGINIPLGILCIAFSWYGFHDPIAEQSAASTLKDKLKRISLIDTLIVVPSITCLLIALQWGGTKYGWGNPRIIALLVFFAVSFSAFGYLQYRQGENATIPPRILKQRSILAAMWFSSCCNGILAVTEYYMSIYFQGVKGYTAFRSGLLALSMLGGLSAAAIAAGLGVTLVGYYSPFMLATSILAPIASGLLTTIDLDEAVVKVAVLLGFLGVAVGFGLLCPSYAVQTVLSSQDVSIGTAIVGFGGGMGSALWIVASATLFDNRLVAEIEKYSPATNVTGLEAAGLSGMRKYIGSQRLKAALTGYDQAVDQTLYMPMALGILTLVGTLGMELRSMKKKQS